MFITSFCDAGLTVTYDKKLVRVIDPSGHVSSQDHEMHSLRDATARLLPSGFIADYCWTHGCKQPPSRRPQSPSHAVKPHGWQTLLMSRGENNGCSCHYALNIMNSSSSSHPPMKKLATCLAIADAGCSGHYIDFKTTTCCKIYSPLPQESPSRFPTAHATLRRT